jgi:hypothetical protein
MTAAVKEIDGRFIIELSNYGYLMFEPLARTNDNQRYSITFKINDAMVINGRIIFSGVEFNKLLEYSMLSAINSMKETLNNIQDEIRKNNGGIIK